MAGSDPFRAVCDRDGWGIQEIATGRFLVDGYDAVEDAWHAFFALENDDLVVDLETER